MIGIDPFGFMASAALNGVLKGAAMQNAQFGSIGGCMQERLRAAKEALRNPDRVERLPNGRGWRVKASDSQLEMARQLAIALSPYRLTSKTPAGHDQPDWV